MTAQVWDLPTGPEFIRSHRTRKNMSQRDLAAEVGVGYPYISKIETGKERPSRDLCHKIAACLDVSGDRLAAMFGYLPDWADELLRTHPSGTLAILARFVNSIIDGDGERSIRSKTGQLADPQPLAEPIPAKGKQGVWEWKEGTRG